jgi:hypothetical protein
LVSLPHDHADKRVDLYPSTGQAVAQHRLFSIPQDCREAERRFRSVRRQIYPLSRCNQRSFTDDRQCNILRLNTFHRFSELESVSVVKLLKAALKTSFCHFSRKMFSDSLTSKPDFTDSLTILSANPFPPPGRSPSEILPADLCSTTPSLMTSAPM